MKECLCLLFVALFILAGCGETGKKITGGVVAVGALGLMTADAISEAKMETFDEYVRKNGVPTSQYTNSSGETIYSYVKMCPNNQGQEEISVTVNKDNKVRNIKQIRSCPAN